MLGTKGTAKALVLKGVAYDFCFTQRNLLESLPTVLPGKRISSGSRQGTMEYS